jgi:hypothetical protein
MRQMSPRPCVVAFGEYHEIEGEGEDGPVDYEELLRLIKTHL